MGSFLSCLNWPMKGLKTMRSFCGDIGEHFGFLDAVPDLYGGCEISFNFLHLTLQEFFAAYHISQMSESCLEERVKTSDGMLCGGL